MTQTPRPLSASLVLQVAWMSVFVGLAMQAIVLLAAALAGKEPGPVAALIGVAGRVSWSVAVCTGLAVGLSVPRASLPGAALWGLACAPLSFHLARAVQQALSAAAGLTGGAAPGWLVWGTSGAKGLQYAALGAALLHLNRRADVGPGHYVGVGLALGLTLGPLPPLLGLRAGTVAASAEALVPALLGEVLFPAFCAGVIWATTRMSEALTPAGSPPGPSA